MFWASPFSLQKPRLLAWFQTTRNVSVITGEKIVPSIVKTKVSSSSFARKHIYLTFKYCGLILSSLNFRPVRLDNREDNRKISGKTRHTRTKFYSTVDWNKRPLFPEGTFRSMELLMFSQFSFYQCYLHLLNLASEVKSNTVFSTSLSLIKVVKLPCSESMSCESPCFPRKVYFDMF